MLSALAIVALKLKRFFGASPLSYTYSFFFYLTACRPSYDKGILHIAAENPGSYEIYSVAGDQSLQFVSEQLGSFNQDLALDPGRYLILADCSNQVVVIHPRETTKLKAHTIEFVPPHAPSMDDLFSIQCTRYEKSHLRQYITNRYNFHMLSGTKDLLVGMLPLKIELQEASESQKPLSLKYHLSALQVAPWKGEKVQPSPYFVSAVDSLLSITQAQEFGRWQFLLPGTYEISLNGTKQAVTLGNQDSLVIEPAALLVSTSEEVNLDLATSIRGNPVKVEVNLRHFLELNTLYPVLAGAAKVRLPGSNRAHLVRLEGSKVNEVPLRSVLIDAGCSPWEWECLGKREVSLFLPDNHYPFLNSVSDVPILYMDEDVTVGLEASTGIRYHLPSNRRDSVLKVAKLHFIPKPTYKAGQYTDLVRLEAISSPLIGFSRDIFGDVPSSMTLISGIYNFARFTSFFNPDVERSVVKQRLVLAPGEERTIDFPFYVAESRAKTLGLLGKGSETQITLRKPHRRPRAFHVF